MLFRFAMPLALVMTLGSIVVPEAALAQNYRTWVASSGNDASADCSRAAPCRRFDNAYGKTNPGGEINCVDSAGYGNITISKPITINCLNVDGTGASNLVSGVTSAIVNGLASNDQVLLRGFELDFSLQSGTPLAFSGAGTLILERAKISNAGAASSGISFAPSGPAKLIVIDSMINGSGGGGSGAGIRVVPSNGGTAQVLLDRVNVIGNFFGVAFDGSNSAGGINATITDSKFSGNVNDGVVATSSPSGAPIGVTVIHSTFANNGFGIRSIGANVTVRVKDSNIIGSGTGLSGGGVLLSGGGNTVQANASNGVFTGSYALQ